MKPIPFPAEVHQVHFPLAGSVEVRKSSSIPQELCSPLPRSTATPGLRLFDIVSELPELYDSKESDKFIVQKSKAPWGMTVLKKVKALWCSLIRLRVCQGAEEKDTYHGP